MSTFLGFTSALIPLGTTVPQMQSIFSSLLASYGWQVLRQAISPTAIISTFDNYYGNVPVNAFDFNTALSATTNSLPAYVGINLATGFTPTTMYITADCTTGSSAPSSFTLDYSSDGIAWTTQQAWTGQVNWTSCECRKFTIASAPNKLYWRINVTAGTSTGCLINTWILEDVNNNWITQQSFFDCIPPTTEVIGNSVARDILRWTFSSDGTGIHLQPTQETLVNWPQAWCLWNFAAGAITQSCTINSNTVSYTGLSTNTAQQNVRGLYEALKTSSNINFTNYNWLYMPNNLKDVVGVGNIIAVAKTASMNIQPTVTGCTWYPSGTSLCNVTTPFVQGSQFAVTSTVTSDLSNGFIYYLQVCARGIALATKTNSNYFTPVHCCYGDNASAVAQTPIADLAPYGIPCTPIELYVGQDNVILDPDGFGYPSHFWNVQQSMSSNGWGMMPIDSNGVWSGMAAPFTHHQIPGMMQDISCNNLFSGVLGSAGQVDMAGENFFQYGGSTGVGTLWSIHKLGSTPVIQSTYTTYVNYGNFTAATFSNLDWYRYSGTNSPANEQLVIGQSNDYTTTVSITGLSTDTIINVSSTLGFPASGWIVLEGELINYTGLTTASFTGCSRGKYNTQAVSPITGTTIHIGAWFVFMGTGLLFVGYNTP